MNFFVAGLPRSRTAWLANFLSYDSFFCFHEGINGCRSMNEYKMKLGTSYGDSCTGLMILDIEKHFPKAPIVIIESDPMKSAKYAEKTYGINNPDYFYKLKDSLDQMNGLRVQYEEIDDNLEKIWRYLHGTAYNEERGNMLMKLNIQMQNPHDINVQAANELVASIGG